MRTIPLEDNFNDILGKVLRGHKLDPAAVAAKAGIEPGALDSLLAGDYQEAPLRSLAPVLDLGPDALVAVAAGTYKPEVQAPAGLYQFNTPYDDYHVNAYMVVDPETREAVVFDTGSDPRQILEAVKAQGAEVALILLTHTHPDHIMGLATLREATGAPAFVSAAEPTRGAEPLPADQDFAVGGLTIQARSTTGHSRGGTSYVVHGLATPLVVVGDALFAGSMGGGMVSFPDALANNRSQIFSLPDETIICPGHGPLTNVGLEKRNNPFYPEFQA